MKKLAIAMLGGALLWIGAGCGTIPANNAYWEYRLQKLSTQSSGTVETPGDRMHTLRQVANQDSRALVDDLDYFFMTDRPSRLSRWHNR